MSNDERNEYMKNVKWTTAGIVFSSTISMIIALVWFTSDIKAEIKNNSVVAHTELLQAVDTIKMDNERRDHRNDLQFQALWNELKNIRPSIIYKYKTASFYTQHKDAHGNLTFQPIK